MELDVATEDSELPDSEPGDPGRIIFLRLRGRPFNFGAAKKMSSSNLSHIFVKSYLTLLSQEKYYIQKKVGKEFVVRKVQRKPLRGRP